MLNRLAGMACSCALVGLSFCSPLVAQQPPAALEGHTNAVSDAIYSPDGKLIATSGFDGAVKIWDSATGAER
jgi:ribosome assembly protein 4